LWECFPRIPSAAADFILGYFRFTPPGFGRLLLGVEDDFEEEQAGGGEDDVVAEEHFDPEGGVAVAGEDGGGAEAHGDKSAPLSFRNIWVRELP